MKKEKKKKTEPCVSVCQEGIHSASLTRIWTSQSFSSSLYQRRWISNKIRLSL